MVTHLVLRVQVDSSGHRPGSDMLESIAATGMTGRYWRATVTVEWTSALAGRADPSDGDLRRTRITR